MADSTVETLRGLGVESPETLLERKIPDYAVYYGLESDEQAITKFIAEAVAVDEVLRQNHRQMIAADVGKKVVMAAHKAGYGDAAAERMLVVRDNWHFRGRKVSRSVMDWHDPTTPLCVTFRHTLDEERHGGSWHHYSTAIGRPNKTGLLWLEDGYTQDDYDVVRNCYYRLLALEHSNRITWMGAHMDKAEIPWNMFHPEHPFDHTRPYYHAPVEYTGLIEYND